MFRLMAGRAGHTPVQRQQGIDEKLPAENGYRVRGSIMPIGDARTRAAGT